MYYQTGNFRQRNSDVVQRLSSRLSRSVLKTGCYPTATVQTLEIINQRGLL